MIEKQYKRYIDNYEDVYIKTPTKKIEIGWEDDVDIDGVNEIVDLLNYQEERIRELETVLKDIIYQTNADYTGHRYEICVFVPPAIWKKLNNLLKEKIKENAS